MSSVIWWLPSRPLPASVRLANLTPSIYGVRALDGLQQHDRRPVSAEAIRRVRRQQGHVAAAGADAPHARPRGLVAESQRTLRPLGSLLIRRQPVELHLRLA